MSKNCKESVLLITTHTVDVHIFHVWVLWIPAKSLGMTILKARTIIPLFIAFPSEIEYYLLYEKT